MYNNTSLSFLKGKSVLVTGGTGSFGQKFIETILNKSEARRVIVFSRDEFKQFKMQTQMPDTTGRLRYFIGDVRDKDRLLRAFEQVDFVVHAAALKQVPAIEFNPFEAIKTNIIGTQNVIEAAIDKNVKKVVLVSTDKAVNPANLYGATKLCAEKLIVHGNSYAANRETRFSAVRYGNVLGSRGSLIQTITEQKGQGVVRLTHPEMTRFWITLDQGVDLVLMALETMKGGEIFVPKIPSMNVGDLIRVLAPQSKVEVTGIRPGEKLHEALIAPEEGRKTKEFEKYYVVTPELDWWDKNHYSDGRDTKEGFFFSSLNNENWLDHDALKGMLGL